MRVFSYGGGVQSTAALVLAAQGKIDFPVFLFANVGDDSEHPATLRYVREVALPYAEAQGIALHEVRHASGETLLAWALRSERSVYLPLRTANGFPGNRSCTTRFKIQVIARWLKQHGATDTTPAVSGIGISLDEFQRARSSSGRAEQTIEYPLLVLRLDRVACKAIISDAGLPIPPKSACWFCPFHRLSDWQRLNIEEPELFIRAVEVERILSERSVRLGRPPVFLTGKGRPLDHVIGNQAVFDFDTDDNCESGYCMV